MKPRSTSTQNLPENDSSHPNDDGCILGTAGRDEDPNATTDWDKAGRDNEPEQNYRDQLNEQDFGEGTDEEHVSRERNRRVTETGLRRAQ